MDELLIEDKKYVSSKKAAQLTGYAKDYIGQLCREGRVPARLVGRSWYVLESAIQDHRFKDKGEEPAKAIKTISPTQETVATWDAPRYTPVSQEDLLPPVSRLVVQEEQEAHSSEPKEAEIEQTGIPGELHESWKSWFKQIHSKKEEEAEQTHVKEEPVVSREAENEQKETEVVAEKGVQVPIRALYEPPPQEFLPRPHPIEHVSVKVEDILPQEEGERSGEEHAEATRGIPTLQLLGTFLAVVALMLSAISTGYFDKYLVSVSQASVISGITVYNK